jgi:cytochrome c oxidase assembly protein subunit 15
MDNFWLHRYAVLVAVCTLFLVVAGASVTSNGAGLSVPDWPLSFGKLMPEMKGGVFYEHGHRMVATAVGMLVIGLVFWLWRSEPRRWLCWLGSAALAAVIVQGVLGGLTVLYKLPKPVSIAHACLAQLFFSTTVAIAVFTSPSWRSGPRPVADSGSPSVRSLAAALPMLLLAQLALGAAHRHKALGIVPHMAGAMVVTVAVLAAAVVVLQQYSGHPTLKRAAKSLMHITLLQVLLGTAAYITRIMTPEASPPMPFTVAFTVAHVAVGALTMAASVVFAMQVFRNVEKTATP